MSAEREREREKRERERSEKREEYKRRIRRTQRWQLNESVLEYLTYLKSTGFLFVKWTAKEIAERETGERSNWKSMGEEEKVFYFVFYFLSSFRLINKWNKRCFVVCRVERGDESAVEKWWRRRRRHSYLPLIAPLTCLWERKRKQLHQLTRKSRARYKWRLVGSLASRTCTGDLN